MSNYQNAVMPTDEWFKKLKALVDFNGKTVVDYGCAEGYMCRLAKEAGAKTVVGIDNQPEHFIPSEGVEFYNRNIEDGRLDHYDIKIFSMIIHWIDKAETLRQLRYSKEAVIIFREKNDNYEIPTNGKWFPTLEELDETLEGFKRKHSELLMTQNEDQNIILAIYEKNTPQG